MFDTTARGVKAFAGEQKIREVLVRSKQLEKK